MGTSDPRPGIPRFVAELMERRVGRAAAMYTVVAFAILQAADLVLPALGAPDWAFRGLVGLALIGFPVTLAVSWYFDLTPEGLRRADSGEVRGGRGAILARRAVLIAVAASALLLGGVALMRTVPASTQLDRDRIVVFPLVMPEGGSLPASAGEDIATMIGHALDRAAALRWIDGWAFLDAAQQLDPRTVTVAAARSIAASQGSGRFVLGRVVAGADSATVLLDLYDVDQELPLQRASARGASAEAWRPGLRAASQLLPALIGHAPPDFAARFTDRDPAAIAHFLAAESAFRRARYTEAMEGYLSAFEADPSFAEAAIRGAQAASWTHSDVEASHFVDAAFALDLTPRDRAFAHGLQAYLTGDADAALLALEHALSIDPRMAAAHAQIGEVHHHLAPSRRQPDSAAAEAFRRGYALDPSAGGVLYHLAQHRIRREGAGTLGGLADEFRAATADPELLAEIELSVRCAIGGPRAVDWQEAAHDRPGPLMEAAVNLAAGELRWPCAEAAYRAILAHDTATSGWEVGRRWSSLKGLFGLLLATGRTEEAMTLVDAARSSLGELRAAADPRFRDRHGAAPGEANPVQFADLLLLLAEAAGYPTGGRAAAVAADNRLEDGSYRSENNARLWFMGIWEASRGNAEAVRAVARRMEHRAATRPGTPRDTLLARSMAAHASVAEGDSATALRILAALRPRGEIQWNEADALGYERLVHARLALAAGRLAEAVEVTTYLESTPTVYPLFLPEALEIRAAALDALRLTSDARAMRARRDGLALSGR
jgi:tetratricopeptide (TPR) repeat protein